MHAREHCRALHRKRLRPGSQAIPGAAPISDGMTYATANRTNEERWAPVIVVIGPIAVGGVRLVKLLRDASLSPIEVDEDEDLAAFVGSLPRSPDLLILPLRGFDDEELKALREARRTQRGREIPILGVVAIGELALDLRILRAHGVVGLLDERQGPGAALDRVLRLVGPLCNRGSERAQCLFPVGVRVGEGPRHGEFALNVSATGIRITSREPLEVNTDVRLRFRLPVISDRRIEARARVVHRSEHRNSWGRYEAGLFFYPLDAEDRAVVEREVDRLLTR